MNFSSAAVSMEARPGCTGTRLEMLSGDSEYFADYGDDADEVVAGEFKEEQDLDDEPREMSASWRKTTVKTEDCRGSHAGFPCGPFSKVRHRPGTGPPFVRLLEFMYGLPTNSQRQQAEADRGSLLAMRSTQITAEVIQCQRLRRVPGCGTLENPPGIVKIGLKDQLGVSRGGQIHEGLRVRRSHLHPCSIHVPSS